MPVRKLSAGALAALVLAGCGSTTTGTSTGTTGTTAASTANTRAEFIAKADALCLATHPRQAALRAAGAKDKGKPVTLLVPLLREQAKIAKGLATSLAALKPPAGDSVAVGRFVHAITEISVFSTAVSNSIHAGHTYAAEVLESKLNGWHTQEALLGQGYGYKVCANGVGY